MHLNTRQFKCDTCDMVFKDKQQLNAHVKSLHERTDLIKCDQSISGLYYHKKVHENTTYNCDNCDKTYKTTSGLKQHQNAEHEFVEITCEECDKKFRNNRLLKIHIKNTHKRLKEVKC